jgi:hypothetical protein
MSGLATWLDAVGHIYTISWPSIGGRLQSTDKIRGG